MLPLTRTSYTLHLFTARWIFEEWSSHAWNVACASGLHPANNSQSSVRAHDVSSHPFGLSHRGGGGGCPALCHIGGLFFLTPERSCWCLNSATTLFKITSHGRVTLHNIMRTFQQRLWALCSSGCDGSQCGGGVTGRNDWVDSRRSMKPYSGAQSQKTDSDKNVGWLVHIVHPVKSYFPHTVYLHWAKCRF